MALPLRKFLKTSKFDALMSFNKPARSSKKSSKGPVFPIFSSPSKGKGASVMSPSGSKKDKASRLLSETGITSRIQRRRSSSSLKSSKGSRRSSVKDEGKVTSVVSVFADKGASAAAKKTSYQVALRKGASGNRSERLQVRLNSLESEMSRLKLHEEQLEHRLKRFLRQRTSLVSTIDDIHLKLENLTRSYKTVSSSKKWTMKSPSSSS